MAASWPPLRRLEGLRFSSTSRSYRVLKQTTDLGGLFAVNSAHAIGLVAGLLALPLALLGLRFQPGWRSVTGVVRAAAVLMVMTGAVHLALIGHHLRTDPMTSFLFFMNGVIFIALASHVTWCYWRLVSAAMLAMTIFGYLGYVAIGFEGPDQVGLATKLIELTALGLVLVPVRGELTAHRGWRWAALGASVPLLTIVTSTTVWIVDLARPDAQHRHAGAVLQTTNPVPTQEQWDAANRLYRETKAAILPYADWRNAWAAGYRPEGPENFSSTHWMNRAYVDAGYVMDPRRPQGLVYANSKHGPVLLGAMFQMKQVGQFGPDPGGPLTAWHQHENICFTPFGFAFSFMTPTAMCPLGAIDISAPPMLHVWIVDNPKGGPFAVDIDDEVVKAIDRS